jgi:hypothetical protein
MISGRAARRLVLLAALAVFAVFVTAGLLRNSLRGEEVDAIAWRRCEEWYATARTSRESLLVDPRIAAPDIQRPLRYAKRCKRLLLMHDSALARRPN